MESAALVASVIRAAGYKPGWALKVGGPESRYLCVFARTIDSSAPDRERTTQHMFRFPDALTEREACRWIFDCLLLAERHEAGEFFTLHGERPFYPHHQDEGSPYELVDRWETLWP